MSKTVPQLGQTVHDLISPAAQIGVHEIPRQMKPEFFLDSSVVA
jgi:hypothetical protein